MTSKDQLLAQDLNGSRTGHLRQKSRQTSSSSSMSFASESSVDDRPEWFTKDTSVQFQKTPAEQDPAVGFFCKDIAPVDCCFPRQQKETCDRRWQSGDGLANMLHLLNTRHTSHPHNPRGDAPCPRLRRYDARGR